jgi:hypothetical protein
MFFSFLMAINGLFILYLDELAFPERKLFIAGLRVG